MRPQPVLLIGAVVVALGTGAGIGVAVGRSTVDPTRSTEYQHLERVVDQKNEGLKDAVAALEQANEDMEMIQGALPQREAAVKKAESGIARRERDVAARELAVRRAERVEAMSTLPGDGTFQVGRDILAGTYRNDGARGGYPYCIVYASTKPGDLGSYLRGSTSKGPAIVQLNAGEYVTAQYCRDFTRS